MDRDSLLFLQVAAPIIGEPPLLTATTRFKATLGITVEVCVLLFNMIVPSFPKVSHRNLVMGINFLKNYPNEALGASLFSISEKTYREICRSVVKMISSLKNQVVSK